jgi:hypothetical protein
MLANLEGRFKGLEDRQASDSIEHGGMTFQDIGAISAGVQTFEVKDLYLLCIDMVTLVMLCVDPYMTITEGMATRPSTTA